MSNEHAEQRKQDLERLIDERKTEEGKLAVKVQELTAEIEKGPERVASAIKGAHESEATIVRNLERDKAEVEAELAAAQRDREPDEAELAEVNAYLDHGAAAHQPTKRKRKAG
jgi:hypothetical protein